MSKYGDDPLAPLPSGHSSTIMSDEFSNSPEKAAREARIARLSHTAAEAESFPDEPKEETRRKKTSRSNKHRGETPPRSPRSSEQPPMSNSSSGSGHRNGSSNKKRSSSRPRSNNSTAATKGRRPRSGESSSNKRPPSPASNRARSSPRPPPSPRPPSVTSPDDTKENRNNNHETTTDVIDSNVEVVAAAPRNRLSKRPSSGLANQVTSRASPTYQITSRRYSNRSVPSDDDDGIVKIEAVPSHVAKGVVSFTTVGSTAADDDEELGIAKGSIQYSSRDLGAGASYPSVWTRLPNTSFGISMGLAGQAIMWKIASRVDFLSTMLDTQLLNTGFWIASLTVGVLLFTAYMLKAWFYFPLVKDEYNDGSRIHFLNMPHLVMMMLTIGVPEGSSVNMMGQSHAGEQIIFGLGFAIQLFFTQHVYQSWLFSDTHNISCARPQFLLSTVGWFFLATLGTQAQIEQEWGLALPSWCFGFGMMLYLMVAIAIFNGIHAAPKAKGSPALFLLIAPPSVGVVAWDLINNGGPGNFSDMSELLLGWCLGVFMLLIKLGPRILQPPPSLGSYWAYVFPMSALASALIRYAWSVGTKAAEVMAIVFVALSMFALLAVFIRMTTHIYRVWAGLAVWGDPLLSPQRLASVSAITYSELIPAIETA